MKSKFLFPRLAVLLFVNSSFLLRPDPVNEVIEMDKKLNLLIIQNNAKEAASFYAEDFMLITSGGNVMNKQDMVDEIASPELKMEINETFNVKVRVHGNTAVLTGMLHQKGVYMGKTFDAKLWVTDTWIKTKRGWQILSGHAGPYKEPVNLK